MANNLKGYDANQVLRSVFEVEKNCLRVCVVEGTTGGAGGFEVIITHINDSIRLGNGTDFFTSTYIGPKIGLDVAVINEVNIEDLDASKDNVAISDGTDTLEINTDGSINVQNTINTNSTGLKKYAEVSSVASGVETTIVGHTALAARRTFLQKISASGDNIAKYKVKVDGTTVDFKRTNFGSNLNADFFFDGEFNVGLEVGAGSTITVTVLHNRGGVSDFNGKIQYLEVI